MKKRILFILCAILVLAIVLVGVLHLTRKPVTIAIIDTGLSADAIPAKNILEGKNYLDPSLSTQDTYGHGTAVASVILQRFPQARFVPLVSNAYDGGRIKQVENDVFAQMIRDAIDVYQCDIIHLSVGLILDKPSIREAVKYAEEKGVLIVASAGNDYDTDGDFTYYPASYETVLAVGSVNKAGTEISAFSQRGDWVDLYACGEAVPILTSEGSAESDSASYAAAHVTAYAAQLLYKDKNLSAQQLREMILTAANTMPDGNKFLP
jgi:subtilisin family serine protease